MGSGSLNTKYVECWWKVDWLGGTEDGRTCCHWWFVVVVGVFLGVVVGGGGGDEITTAVLQRGKQEEGRLVCSHGR